MPIQFLCADLFDNAHHAQEFAHGCNCQGSMGAGIAKTFRSRYAEIYEEYVPGGSTTAVTPAGDRESKDRDR